MKFKAGDEIICTHLASCGFTTNKVYKVYINEEGLKCIRGDDGLEDLLSLVISTFHKFDPTKNLQGI